MNWLQKILRLPELPQIVVDDPVIDYDEESDRITISWGDCPELPIADLYVGYHEPSKPAPRLYSLDVW